MRLLHAADLHLDRSFEGIAEFPDWLKEPIQHANGKVWQNIVHTAIEQQVDLLILAGDTFHQTQASLKMQHLFFKGLEELSAHQIHTVICFGNHDYYQSDRFWFSFPEDVLIFTQEEVTTEIIVLKNGEKVAVSSFSYQHQWLKNRKDTAFPARKNVDYHIGIYHGENGSDNSYAPFQISEMQAKGYDYWALGHIHKGAQLFDRGWYAGTPQGHSTKEAFGTGILLVDLVKSNLQVTRKIVEEISWRNQTISLKEITDVSDLQSCFLQKIDLQVTNFQLLRIALKDYQHLGKNFIKKVESGELLPFLSSIMANESRRRIFLWQIELLQPLSSLQTLALPAELLEQSLTVYQNKEIFEEAMRDLFEQPELIRIIDKRNFQQVVLSEAKKLIQNQLEI